MGLCKCPKRKVTNLFCFEHKVNVCENCLVTDHVRCIIKSYLQWLQDSDFETSCCICQDSLEAGDVVRLLCYDVLHVSCAEKFLLAYPGHTAPDGFFCPACHGPFFPPELVASPVADQLRAALEGMKDLQKRLQGLTTVVPEHSKTSPPVDQRPEPEGKEGYTNVIDDGLPANNNINQTTKDSAVVPPDVFDVLTSADAVLEEYAVRKDKDDAESDSISSASDFIATHSGSHIGDAEQDVNAAPSSPSWRQQQQQQQQKQPQLPTRIPADVPAAPAVSAAASDFSAAAPDLSPAAPDDVSTKVALGSLVETSLPAGAGVASESTPPTYAIQESRDAHVVLDLGDDVVTLPRRSSPIKSTSISMVESVSSDAPTVLHIDAAMSGRTRGGAGEGWPTAASPPAPSPSAASPPASAPSAPSPSVDSVATSTASSRAASRETGFQRHANAAYAEPEHSVSPPPQHPFSEHHHQYGANARSSSSFAPRVSFSHGLNVPRGEDHDDHKYRRKPIMEVVRTWLKIFSPPRGRRSASSLWRRFVIIVLIAVLSLVCLVLLFHHMGRSGRADDDDPLLDLKANPFVKVDDA